MRQKPKASSKESQKRVLFIFSFHWTEISTLLRTRLNELLQCVYKKCKYLLINSKYVENVESISEQFWPIHDVQFWRSNTLNQREWIENITLTLCNVFQFFFFLA